MASRLSLHKLLTDILGSQFVYYQPPESIKMSYPAIRYSLSDVDVKHANDSIYKSMNRYELILIDANPESAFFKKLLKLPYCSFDRHYSANNLNHFVFTLYY